MSKTPTQKNKSDNAVVQTAPLDLPDKVKPVLQVPTDLPKVRGAVPPSWLFEVHFKCIDGHVFLIIHPQGKPEFPIQNGIVSNGIVCCKELVEALEQSNAWDAPRG